MQILNKILGFSLALVLVFVATISIVKADEATPSAEAQTEETPAPSATPEPSVAPEVSPTPSPTPEPTLAPESDPEVTAPGFLSGVNQVSVGTTYTMGLGNAVKVKFNSINGTPGSLDVDQSNLSQSQIDQLGSVSNAAYVISSSMPNGSFTYDLTLPLPANFHPHNLKIKYAEDISDIGNAQVIGNSYTINSDNTITIHDLNHFTVFVVSDDPADAVCIGAGGNCYSTIQAAVDAANAGDTINVQFGSTGTYNETVTVNKALTFNGTGNPTIDTMIITASPVSINGIHVNNLSYPDNQAPVISGISLINQTTGNNSYVKNGDTIQLRVTITDNNQSSITISMITANLSTLGGGSAVHPISYDTNTGLAIFANIVVSGTTNGSISITVDATDAASNNAVSQNGSILSDNLGPGQATNLTITNPINNGNKTSISISGNGEVGSTVNYTISNGASNVSGSTTVDNTGAFSVTGIDVSSLGDGTLTLSVTLTDAGGNASTASTTTTTKDVVAPTVSAGSNQVKNGQFAQLGTASDATSGVASTTWTQVSGPGTITFGSANALSTTISASVDGTYVIRLTTVDNAGNSSNSTFTLTWDTTAPASNAGSNVTTNAQFTQTGTASDALSGVASTVWSQVSGPGTITFGSANSLITTISADTDGTYVVRLTVTDVAGNSSTSTFTLIWDVTNPVVSAGSNKVTNAQFTQTGTATDATSGVASTVWSQVSGPGTIVFGNANALSTTISADADGVYIIRLTVTDNAGNVATSTFSLTWDTTNPTANAGSNVVTNTQFTQTGTASDVLSGVVSTVWSQISGPGVITFGSLSSLTTTVSGNVDGVYVIQLTVTDAAGNVATSTFSLTWDQTNPIVNAGSNVTTNTQFTQVGTVSDATSGVASTTWSQISGLGTITFGNSNALSTTISADTDGTYIIQLTVTDVAGNSASSTFTLVWDTVSANVNVGGNIIINAQFSKTATVTDPAPSSGIASTVWSQISGPGVITFGTPNSVTTTTTTISADADGVYIIQLTVIDNSGNSSNSTFSLTWDQTNPNINAGSNVTINTQFTQVGTASDVTSGVASTVWSQVSGPGLVTFGSANALSTTISADTDGTYVIQLTVTDNAGNVITSTFTLIWDVTNPTVNAGANVVTNAQFTQNGSASDVTSGIASTVWTQVSGPGTIAFGNANALSTTISADADGVYIIQLTVTDVAGNSTISTFTLTWDVTNPISNAGANVVTNAQFTQVGTASDTTSGVASTVWSQVSGPGTITFGSANALTTTISADLEGVYVLRLTVTDAAGNVAISTFTLTWDTTNPTANAGSNVATNAQFTQTGTASDALSGVASTVWSQVSGPGTITFGNSNALSTTISADADGVYVIQLTVTDAAGNSNTSTFTLTWDTTNPTGSWVSPYAGQVIYGIVNLNFSSSDSLSGVASTTFQYQRNDGVDTFHTITSTWDTAGLALDLYTLRMIVVDQAGNSVNIDQTIGIGTVITPPAQAPVASSQTNMTITWITGNLATSRVIFDTVSHGSLSLSPNYGYAFSTVESDLGKVFNHSVTLDGLNPGVTYYYRMVSKGSPESVSGEFSFRTETPAQAGSGSGSSSSGGGSSSCNDTKPGIPTLLSVVANSLNQVVLRWSKASGSVSYYLITYGLSSGKQQYGNPNVGGADTTSYTVGGLQSGTTYYFRVRAGNGCVPGDFSNELSNKAGGNVFSVKVPATGFIPGVLGSKVNVNNPTYIKDAITAPQDVPTFKTPAPLQFGKAKSNNGLLGAIVSFIKNLFSK